MSYQFEITEQACVNAYRNTSHFPERSGKHLHNDLRSLYDTGMASVPETFQEQFHEGFHKRAQAWVSAKANTASWFITGPANFPVQRMRKKQEREQRMSEALYSWVNWFIAKVNRQPAPTIWEQLADAQKRLAMAKSGHALMLAINKELRKKGATPDSVLSGLKEKGIEVHPPLIHDLFQHPSYLGKVGYEGFSLSYSLSKIKRLELRLQELERKVEIAEGSETPKEYKGGNFTVCLNAGINRVQIIYEERVSTEHFKLLRQNGFVYSRANGAFQRMYNNHGLVAVLRVIPPEDATALRAFLKAHMLFT